MNGNETKDPAISAVLDGPTDSAELPELPTLEAPVAEQPPAQSDSGEPPREAIASIFANPKDLWRYRVAKEHGASEDEALSVGDNGQGKWGDITATYKIPMVALPRDTPGLAHNRLVEIEGPGGKVIAKVADVMPASDNLKGKATIDLNPAAAMAVGHTGGLAPVKWKFVGGVQGLSLDTPDAQSKPFSFGGAQLFQPQLGQSDIPGGDTSLPALPSLGGEFAGPLPTDLTPVGKFSPAMGEDPYENSVAVTQWMKTLKPGDKDEHGFRIVHNPDGTVAGKIGPDRSFIFERGGQIYTRTADGQIKATGKPKIDKEDKPDTATLKEANQRGIILPEGTSKTEYWKQIGEYDKSERSQEGHVYENLPPEGKVMADQMGQYKMAMPQAGRIFSGKDPLGRRILAAAYERYPNLNQMDYQARQQYMREWKSTRPGTAGGQRDSLNRLIEHLQALDEVAQELPAHALTPANRLENWINSTEGKPYQARFNDAKHLVVAELERLVTMGVPAVANREEWEHDLNAANSKEQLVGQIRGIIPKLMESPLDIIREGYESRMGEPPKPNDIIYPHVRKALQKLGINPDEGKEGSGTSIDKVDIKPGDIIESNGKRWQLKPGGDPKNTKDYILVQ